MGLLFLGVLKILRSRKVGLSHSKKQQYGGSKKRDKRPWRIKVSVLEASPLNMPTISVISVNIIEQLGQITQIQINRHIFSRAVDEAGNFSFSPKVILNHVPITQILNVPVSVHETVQESNVGREVLGAPIVALLKRHTVQQKTTHEIVHCKSRHLNLTAPERHVKEAVAFLARTDLNPGSTKLGDAMDHVGRRGDSFSWLRSFFVVRNETRTNQVE